MPIGFTFKDKTDKTVSFGEVNPNRVLLCLDKFCDKNVTKNMKNKNLIEVKNMSQFFQKFTDEGYFVFEIDFENGIKEKIEIGSLQDMKLDVLTTKSKFSKHLKNREKLLTKIAEELPDEIVEKSDSILQILSSIPE